HPGDLRPEVRFGERVAATGPGVVEGARAYDMHAVALVTLPAHQVLRHLADGVGREGPERVRLANRQFVGLGEAVLLARADHQKSRGRAELAHSLEEVHLTHDVRIE